jgi:hypothetical protein
MEVKESGHVSIPVRFRRVPSDSAWETVLLPHGYDPALLRLPHYEDTHGPPNMNMNDPKSTWTV